MCLYPARPGGVEPARSLRMLPFFALSTAFAGPPPARMHATLPGVKDPSPYTIYSGYLDAGVPPSGRGKM